MLPVGLQPTTYRLGGGRSMHLSYGSESFSRIMQFIAALQLA